MSAAAPPVGAVSPGAAPSADQARVDWIKLLIGFGAMVVGQFMAILDIQIVAASLPQIQAGVGASADEVTWIQTAYLIPEVVMIPLSAYLSRLWGTRPLYLMSCAGFVVMSVIAGLSTSIEMMIVSRALQGFIGGAMIPTVFAVAYTAFPPDKRVSAGVAIGLIVTLAPTIGPTLGGHITESLSWRWLFFINAPIGAVVMFLVARYGDFDKGDPKLAKGFDWWGLGLMAVFLMSLQYVLEEGSKAGWFDDETILGLAVVVALTGPAFVWRTLAYANPLVELRAFRDRNFLIGVCMTFVSGATLFGGTFLLPQFLGHVRQFSAAEIGSTMVISGLSMFLTAPIAGRLARKVDARVLMVVGFGMVAFGMWLGRAPTPEWGFAEFVAVQAFRGVGVMLAMIASQTVTMSTLPPPMVKNASALVNLFRNVGGAVGLALLATTLTNRTAAHLSDLTQAMSVSRGGSTGLLETMIARYEALGVADPEGAAAKAVFGMIHRQAATLAYGDAFMVLAIGGALAAAAALFARPVKAAAAPAEGVH